MNFYYKAEFSNFLSCFSIQKLGNFLNLFFQLLRFGFESNYFCRFADIFADPDPEILRIKLTWIRIYKLIPVLV